MHCRYREPGRYHEQVLRPFRFYLTAQRSSCVFVFFAENAGSTGQGNGQGGLQALVTPAEDDSVIDSDDSNEALSETGGQHDTDSEAEHTDDEGDDDDGDRGARGGGQTNEGTAVSRHWRSAKDNSYISDFGEESIDGQLLGDRQVAARVGERAVESRRVSEEYLRPCIRQ